jgi:integrase
MAARLAFKKQGGMTTKNRDRLRTLQAPAALRRLLLLPYRLFDRAEARGDTLAAALEREEGVAIAILLTIPIRRHNLATIHLERNLQRPGDGTVFLAFAPDEVKNRQAIAAQLPPDVVVMIARLLATRSPRLCPAATPWLFPCRDGSGQIHDDWLSKRIFTRIRKEIGLDVNPHLFRHLSAKLLLDANPGGCETVRQVLGHSRLSTTFNVYTGLEADSATRLFAEVIEAARMR